ncbi:MAG: HalOD1 output domain-containing protein [Halovenus sp.]
MRDQDIVRRVTDALARADQAAPEQSDYNLHEDINPTVLRMLANHEHTRWELSFDALDHEVTVTSEEGVFVDGVRFDAREEPIYE